jgi:AcrR family transcriptional regulator
MSDVVDTKELIIDTFIGMTSSLGFENVSVRDIAHQAGINVASIYYYFKTKASLLEYAYDYHGQHQYDYRKTIEEMKKIVEAASADEIIQSIMYEHGPEDQKHFVRMALITKIIYMRLFQDPLAKAAFFGTYRSNSEYIGEIIRYGIKIGRVDPAFDIATFSDILIGVLQSMGIRAFGDVNYVARSVGQQKSLLSMVSRILAASIIK